MFLLGPWSFMSSHNLTSSIGLSQNYWNLRDSTPSSSMSFYKGNSGEIDQHQQETSLTFYSQQRQNNTDQLSYFNPSNL